VDNDRPDPGEGPRGELEDILSYLNEDSLPRDAAMVLKSAPAPAFDRYLHLGSWISRLDPHTELVCRKCLIEGDRHDSANSIERVRFVQETEADCCWKTRVFDLNFESNAVPRTERVRPRLRCADPGGYGEQKKSRNESLMAVHDALLQTMLTRRIATKTA
jgi:hypothetical protein